MGFWALEWMLMELRKNWGIPELNQAVTCITHHAPCDCLANAEEKNSYHVISHGTPLSHSHFRKTTEFTDKGVNSCCTGLIVMSRMFHPPITNISHDTGYLQMHSHYKYLNGKIDTVLLSPLTSGYAHSSIHPPFPLWHISLTPSGATPKGRSQCRVSMKTLTSSSWLVD